MQLQQLSFEARISGCHIQEILQIRKLFQVISTQVQVATKRPGRRRTAPLCGPFGNTRLPAIGMFSEFHGRQNQATVLLARIIVSPVRVRAISI
jgi:hypothetical protein